MDIIKEVEAWLERTPVTTDSAHFIEQNKLMESLLKEIKLRDEATKDLVWITREEAKEIQLKDEVVEAVKNARGLAVQDFAAQSELEDKVDEAISKLNKGGE